MCITHARFWNESFDNISNSMCSMRWSDLVPIGQTTSELIKILILGTHVNVMAACATKIWNSHIYTFVYNHSVNIIEMLINDDVC